MQRVLAREEKLENEENDKYKKLTDLHIFSRIKTFALKVHLRLMIEAK